MSDPDAPDPMDNAYAQAEAVLSDEAARAARRARVLAAVVGEPAAPAAATPATRRPAYGRWLVAAGVAGVGVFLATQLYLPALSPQPAPAPPPPAPLQAPAPQQPSAPQQALSPRPPAVAAPAAQEAAVPPPAPASPPLALSKPVPQGPAPAPPAAQPSSGDLAAAAPSPPPPAAPKIAPAYRAAPAAAPASSPSNQINEIVVTGERRVQTSSNPAARLREAAAAGRIDDVAALLARRVAVDAADEEGETALMKAVQADQPVAAALLRRHGASLDRKNHAGDSARDMAKPIGDAALNQALGLGP